MLIPDDVKKYFEENSWAWKKHLQTLSRTESKIGSLLEDEQLDLLGTAISSELLTYAAFFMQHYWLEVDTQ